MFLYSISERQKILFMQLAIKAAEANGVVGLEEKNMIKAYGMEMGITPFFDTESSTEEIISELTDICDEQTKRIIVFEILGLMLSDSLYDDKEKSFVKELINAFSISNDYVDKINGLIEEYADLYRKISSIVL